MKKTLLIATLIAAFSGCSSETTTEGIVTAVNGTNGTSCSVAPEYSTNESNEQIGARISCTDGSFSIVLNGPQGEVGLSGAIGPVGESCVASRRYFDDKIKIQCGNQSPVYIYDGDDGRNGRDGQSCSVSQQSNGARITCGHSVAFVYNGSNGQNGASCSVSNLSNGVRVTCGNTSQDLFDGEDGQDSPLTNAIGIAGYIRPCGNEFANDEIFLRMTDGNILALYDGGPHEDRLVLLAPGNYITTDRNRNRTCNFTVTNSLQITNERVQ